MKAEFRGGRRVAAFCSAVLFPVVLTLPVFAAVPSEVSNLGIANDRLTLSWDATAGATSYNVYRGYVRDLAANFYGTFLEGEVSGTTYQDPQTPAAGETFFYLITAANSSGEGTMGTNAKGVTRPNNYPWPGYAVAGKWQLRGYPDTAIHMAVLRTGKVIAWQTDDGNGLRTRIYDPKTDTISTQTVNTNLFCSGHSFLPDGKLLVIGGNTFLFSGYNTSYTFDPTASFNGWVQGPFMQHGRYYPTATELGDGRVLAHSGNDENGGRNLTVEVYSTQGTDHFDLQPNGKVFHAGPEKDADRFDSSAQTWTPVASSHYGLRGEGTAVLLPPGFQKVMIIGGRRDPQPSLATNTAEVIDLAASSPSWSYTGSMRFPRTFPNSVILPDGKVLIVGGGYDDNIATYPAEIFDPNTSSFTVVASMKSFRLYHSTAVLLPDGRVMAGGSNGNNTVEFYSPPYLYKGDRPVISSLPASVRYGSKFTIGTSDASSITSVVMMRTGAVTHAFNQDQRHVPLSFTAGSGSLTATAPDNSNTAPPGYYMLFILKGNGVPSEASFTQLK